MRTLKCPSGFSLVEVMVAAAILGCAVLSVAQLVATATTATADARRVSEATLLAWQKMDELRSLAFAFDDAGLPVTDPQLSPSPAGTLSTDTDGYVERLDDLYRRRWAIAPAAGDPDLLLLRVRVVAAGRENELASAVTLRARRRP
jgi:prepilin-type N-terminal cleavage/methylation domain-containing protein